MLTALSIRDIVIIEKLDLFLSHGLTTLTGETGAGKSILLDSLGLALGARGDATLVRQDQDKGSVVASFNLPDGHAGLRFLLEQNIDIEGDVVVKRIQSRDGSSRAFINDTPVSLAVLRQFAAHVVELHGQHADRAFVSSNSHRGLLDSFGQSEERLRRVQHAWREWSSIRTELENHETAMSRAEVERDYLEHAVAELTALAPEADEEQSLASRRQLMMQAEQFVSALAEAENVLSGEASFESRLNAALRRLERKKDSANGQLDGACVALEKVLIAFSEAGSALESARRSFVFDQNDLEKAEERLFSLRAAARKFRCTVADLPGVLERMQGDLTRLDNGADILAQLQSAEKTARAAYETAADALSAHRKKVALALDKAVAAELPALKLGHARFFTEITADASKPTADGFDRVEFKVATNPGTPPQPIMKIASGGELARFMLALKVVLASKGSAPVLIFDEIDTGVGGAVAEAIGARLRKLAEGLQIIAVTHSPQVAAKAQHHLLIEKSENKKNRRMTTSVKPLHENEVREELARMLSGAAVTDAARAQADALRSGSAP